MNDENSRRNYNGWTNYETWVVRLWLDNEEATYRYWTGEARRWHGQEEAANRLAEQLKDELSEASPVNEPTVYGDLMNAALEEVNWLEIAESYLDEVAEDVKRGKPDDAQSTAAEESCNGQPMHEETPESSKKAPEEEGKRRLSIEEIENLSSPAEFDALPEEDKQRYYRYMDAENFPTASEFYGYFEEHEDRLAEELGDFDVPISIYSRRQAIEDGVLVDVSETAREAGFRLPVAVTHAVWAQYVTVPDGVEGQDERGRLWDILWMGRYGIAQLKDRDVPEVLFQLHVRNDNREAEPPLVTLKAVCGPDDDYEPCVTIMLPDED